MRPLEPKEIDFWQKYLSSIPESDHPNSPQISAGFCGNKEIADELLDLFLKGMKTAASGIVKEYQIEEEPLPKVGDFWIILDSQENPACIVKVVRIERHLFKDVPDTTAWAEGEGDRTLQYWRRAHIDFFTPFLPALQIQNLEEAEIITEFYQRVF